MNSLMILFNRSRSGFVMSEAITKTGRNRSECSILCPSICMIVSGYRSLFPHVPETLGRPQKFFYAFLYQIRNVRSICVAHVPYKQCSLVTGRQENQNHKKLVWDGLRTGECTILLAAIPRGLPNHKIQ